MASSPPLGVWCFLLAVLGVATTCCKSDADAADQDPVGIVARALHCFNDHYVYSSCQESYRLNQQGSINVPPEATDEYCNGPCLVETKLVLNCVDNILYNFKFYNGASIRDVMYTLNTGCGHTAKRGDFNVIESLGVAGGYSDYGHGNRLATPVHLILLGCGLLLM